MSIEFLLPGFMILGTIGVILIIVSWVNIVMSFGYLVVFLLIILELLIIYFLFKLCLLDYKNKIILESSSKNTDNFIDLESYLGKEGITKTPLRPIGRVTFDDKEVEAISNIKYIDSSIKVKCVKILDNKIYVEKIN